MGSRPHHPHPELSSRHHHPHPGYLRPLPPGSTLLQQCVPLLSLGSDPTCNPTRCRQVAYAQPCKVHRGLSASLTRSKHPWSPTATPSQVDWNPIVHLWEAEGLTLLQQGVLRAPHHTLDVGKAQHQVMSSTINVKATSSPYVLVDSQGWYARSFLLNGMRRCLHNANDFCSSRHQSKRSECEALHVCVRPDVASLPRRQVSAILKTCVPRVSYFGKWLAGFQQAPSTQEEIHFAYRQQQAQPCPPAMPAYARPPPQAGLSPAASYGSDHGSLDDSSMSGSEAMSGVKRMEVCKLRMCIATLGATTSLLYRIDLFCLTWLVCQQRFLNKGH